MIRVLGSSTDPHVVGRSRAITSTSHSGQISLCSSPITSCQTSTIFSCSGRRNGNQFHEMNRCAWISGGLSHFSPPGSNYRIGDDDVHDSHRARMKHAYRLVSEFQSRNLGYFRYQILDFSDRKGGCRKSNAWIHSISTLHV
jgi:hypothetical protein